MSMTILAISNLGPVAFTRSKRAKYQRITVRPDKTVTVTIPRRGSLSEAKQFLKSKISWVQKHLHNIDKHIQGRDTSALDIDLEKVKVDLFNRLDYFSKKHSFSYKKVCFRCQKTRWGSCSGKNNINLNVNIAFLPEELQNFVLLHELVHTKIKNHSRVFWTELDKYVDGRAKELSKDLKNYRIRLSV